jgi:hypothetical protein
MVRQRRGLQHVVLMAAFFVLAMVMTWPLGRLWASSLPASDDAYFTVWRLAWIAHQLPTNPAHVFDANILHPATNTLAYSDAMLLVGAMAQPFFALGLDPALIHNLMLLLAIASSMVCAFALARYLTGSAAAATLAALVFGLAPYRIAHIGHLELQWTMWMPLSMLLLHRLLEAPSAWRGALLGATLAAQVLCSIYYGAFLACYLGIAWLALIPFAAAKERIVWATSAATLPLLVVVFIYGPAYAATHAQFGERSANEVQRFSAEPGDYLRVPPENLWRGSSQPEAAPDERSLFPGAIAVVLAGAALATRPVSRVTVTYTLLALVAADFSLGLNGLLFPLLQKVVGAAGSLRAPARFGVLVLMSIAMLAAIGADRIFRRWPHHARAAALMLSLLCVAEYWSAPLPLRAVDLRPAEIDRWLSSLPAGTAIAQLPTPTTDTLWLAEPLYQMRSINHWQPMVNGYSAFLPADHARLFDQLDAFPERPAILALRDRGVKYILIHRRLYPADRFDRLMESVDASTRLSRVGTFDDHGGEVVVVELNYQPES